MGVNEPIARTDGGEHDGRPAVPAVEVVDVRAGYRSHAALEHVCLTVPRGSMMAIVGPNGGGKSTLLKLLLGLLEPWEGTVRVLGTDPVAARGRVGYVPQTRAGDWSFP